MASLGKGEGFFIISTGVDRRSLLMQCLASIERHYPGAPVCVMADYLVDVPFRWLRPTYNGNAGAGFDSRRYKTNAYNLSPFETTVMIDDDTVIHWPFGEAGGLLTESFPLAMVPDGGYTSLAHYKRSGRGGENVSVAKGDIPHDADGMPYYSSGVMIWRRDNRVAKLFDAWHEFWLPYQERDQQPLIQAMLATGGYDFTLSLPAAMNYVRELNMHDRAAPMSEWPANIIHFWKDKLSQCAAYGRLMNYGPLPTHQIAQSAYNNATMAGGQMTPQQYRAIGAVIAQRAPCRVLVFGCGNDSRLWAALNRNGETVFVEDNEAYAAAAQRDGLNVLFVRYPSRRGVTANRGWWVVPGLQLGDTFDVVIVDGPRANTFDSPGRFLAMSGAVALTKHDGALFIHDFQRAADRRDMELAGLSWPETVVPSFDTRGDLAAFFSEKADLHAVYGLWE